MSMNVCAITGRLTADPEVRSTNSGVNVCNFTVAVDRNFVKQGEERQADFIPVIVWRQTADFVAKYFKKGDMIAVDGSIQTRKYQDKDGSNRIATEIVANNVSFCGGKRDSSADKAEHNANTTNNATAAPAAHGNDDDEIPF